MRAFVVTAPGHGAVMDVDPPVAGPGQVVVDVERVGVCGTDVEFFTGEMAYLHQGHARYPLRLGHEWCGRVRTTGEQVDPAWAGRRVTADTMLGCGRCGRCATGRQHLCEARFEIGIRGGWPGALAEQLVVPATALHALPDRVDAVAGALVEPGGNALRTVRAAQAGPGSRLAVFGPGTIGVLAALFAVARGAEVHVVGPDAAALEFVTGLASVRAWTLAEVAADPHALAGAPFDAVIDASTGPEVPALAVRLVEPGGRVVLIGLSGQPSLVDTRDVVLADVTVVGVLSASPGLAGAIADYASAAVDPTPLVAATVGLADTAAVLAGWRPPGCGPGPKVHVDPRR